MILKSCTNRFFINGNVYAKFANIYININIFFCKVLYVYVLCNGVYFVVVHCGLSAYYTALYQIPALYMLCSRVHMCVSSYFHRLILEKVWISRFFYINLPARCSRMLNNI
jgi:hypothetical protein